MDTRLPRSRGIKKYAAPAVTTLLIALVAGPLAAAPAYAAPARSDKTYLEYYVTHEQTAQTRYLNRTLHRLTDPLRAPDKPVTVKKTSAVGYAAYGFDCGIQVTHKRGAKKHVYDVAIFSFGRLDQPASNALDYPYAGKYADRHVLVTGTKASPAGIDRLLKRAHTGCS